MDSARNFQKLYRTIIEGEKCKKILRSTVSYSHESEWCIIPESDTGILGKKIRVLLSGVEPKTFRLLVRMLYHFPSMPVSLSGIIHHSHSFTRPEIYHHIHFIVMNLFLTGLFLLHNYLFNRQMQHSIGYIPCDSKFVDACESSLFFPKVNVRILPVFP